MRFFFRYIFIFFTLSLPIIIHAQDSGNALKFDGINDYVKIENSPSLTLPDFTLEGWFNFSSIPSGHAHMLGKTLGTDTLESYTIFYKYGNLHGLISDKNGYGPWLTYEWDIKAGTWYHIAYTFDDTKNVQALYINGELVDSGTVAKSVEYDSHPVLIGANHENENLEYFFPGQIKETRIWNVARTQEEIQADMNKVLSENENGLAGYWRFNEGQGQTASDSSANDNHGQLGSSPDNDDSDPMWVVHGANGHFYEVFIDTEVSWHQAKAIAEDMGGYLATITSAEEQQFIEDLLISSGAPTGAYWFGLVETGTEGVYTWDNGELLSYTNWCKDQPDNWHGADSGQILWTVEPEVHTFARRGTWDDVPSEGIKESSDYPDLDRRGYIVESQPTECIEDDSGSIDITGKSGPCGGKLTIPVRIQNTPNAANSIGFDVAFDSDVLVYTGFTKGELAEPFDFFNVTKISNELVRCGGFKSEELAQGSEGDLLYLQFDVSAKCHDSKLELRELKDDISTWTASHGCFSMKCTGDVNNDGEITPKDALCVFEKYLEICPTSCGIPCDEVCGDVTADGECTPADGLCIFRKYLEIPGCLDQ